MEMTFFFILLSAALRSSVSSHYGRSFHTTEQRMTWTKAQTYCRKHHTDLVTLHSQDDTPEDISTWISSKLSSPGPKGSHEDNDRSSSSGSQSDGEKTRGGCGSDFWIRLIDAQWEPKDCGKKWSRCEDDELHYALCYKEEIHLIQENKTWERALHYCNNHYKGLLRIESQHDQQALEAELNRVLEAALKNSTAPGPVWLGLRQSRLFGFWFWPNGLSVGWSNWEGQSQPEQPLSHICGAIATSGPGKFKWSDQNCLSESYFLCEGKQR